jgi:hypothetical protein
LWILLHLGQASMIMCFMHSNTLYRKCLVGINIVFSCMMKCQSELIFESEVLLHWGFWWLWKSGQGT